jgi:hypothetical protein
MVHVFGFQILGGVMTLALGGAGFYFGMYIDICTFALRAMMQ